MKKSRLPRIKISEDTTLYVEQIAIGGFAPLDGFMNKEDYESVLKRKRLADGQVWTIPINLAVKRSVAARYTKGDRVALVDSSGSEMAQMDIEDLYPHKRRHAAEAIYGTRSMRHPGVKHLHQLADVMVGGKVKMLRAPFSQWPRYKLKPSQTRRMFAERGWRRIAAFHTRNAPHRAHEYLQRTALEVVDGLLIHPFVGRRKDGDFSSEIVIKGYKALIKNYYPKDKVILACLEIPMTFAGPREAAFHAIIRRNYGCTHFIVGRDHAGVGGFYDKYAAHRIFDELPDIGITPLKLQGPFYCRRCSRVVTESSCGHGDKERVQISGTIIRNMVKQNKMPPVEIMRPEVSRVILKYS
ncbi:MAG: sulfate adenylyltransferase [Candidatus Omnitrophica bacterium]|nr:sulfate adenylyltransferase [Candidatus Omnitrophota bacterium]